MGVHLKASRCRLCGALHHPPRAICPRCGPGSRGSLEEVELPDRGRVVAYTVLHYPPEGYPSPMILAVAEVGGVRLIGRVVGDLEAVGEGCEVEVVEGEGAPYLFLLEG
ncbi:MAG: transcriptional regulator [Candidatus Bathyarchaeota archaeon B23]|nr:MAG: transcriptional regulator [Candidatus Bathyarchaeota archaeon B23]